jgi:hypothetical protein
MKMAVFWIEGRVEWYEFTNVPEFHTVSIRAILLMEAARTSGMLVSLY